MTHINKLPKDWEIKQLEDLLDYIQPTKYIVKSTDYDNSYKTPVLTAGKTFVLGKTNETEGIFENLPVIIFDDFTTANKLVNFKFKVKSSAMKILKPKDENVNLLFVFYFIQTIRISFDTHKRYWISVFSKLPITLPPPEIQNAIVSKIEELFSELDKGVEDLKTAQQQLKTYRQSVLKWAFEGKLTEEWRNKVKKNILDKPYWETNNTKKYNNSFEIIIPQSWIALPIGNVCEFQQGMQIAKNTRLNFKIEGCLPILRIKNYKDSFKTDVEYIKIDENSLIAEKEDIIMTRTGESRGNILTGFKGVFHNNTFRINYSESHLNREYLIYYLSSTKIQNFIKENSGRTGQPDLTHRNFGPCTLAIPSLEEQNQIVQELESRLSIADKMEESIAQSLQQAEALRQSILKKAFSGELV
jgi:type I restriction enzyme S subunit